MGDDLLRASVHAARPRARQARVHHHVLRRPDNHLRHPYRLRGRPHRRRVLERQQRVRPIRRRREEVLPVEKNGCHRARRAKEGGEEGGGDRGAVAAASASPACHEARRRQDSPLHPHAWHRSGRPSLDILDNVLRVSGQTKDRRVDRRILLPCNADPETLSATYADGEITIVMERKAGKKIAIKKTPVVFGHHPQAPSEKDEAAAAGPRERADKKETAHEPQEDEMTTAESKEPSLQRKSDARSAEEVKETGEEEWEEWPKDASSDC